jgi:ribosomal protein S20
MILMPITKQAIKKLHRDSLLRARNARVKSALRDAVKSMRKHPTVKALTGVFSHLDKAAKSHIIHKNTSRRLKSRLSRLLSK